MNEDLNERLLQLREKGYQPSIYLRGYMWRAHVNAGDNFWGEADTPLKALELALKQFTDG